MREANKQKEREQIAAAFIEMVENSSLEKISTQELCRKAGVSKSTFYRLFPDKYEVAIWLYHSWMDPIVSGSPDLRRSKEWCVCDLEELRKHRKFYRSVAAYRGQNSMLDYLAAYFYQNIVKYRNPSAPEPTEDQLYAIRMYASICAQARDSHHIQTEPLVLHESGNSNYLCPDYSPTVFLSRNSTCCIRLACLEHTFPLAHPNLQSSIFFRDARK